MFLRKYNDSQIYFEENIDKRRVFTEVLVMRETQFGGLCGLRKIAVSYVIHIL
jgi:hypothetical protein